MGFGRAGSNDVRRRRVVLDERNSPPPDGESDEADSPAPRERKGRANSKRYSDHALPEYQPRISCVLPVRGWVASTVAAIGVIAICGLEFLYYKLPTAGSDLPAFLSVFDVTSPTGLATWLSSILLFASAVVSMVVFALRRHRLDDYRGRYRFWLWHAAALLIASMDQITGLHQAIPYTAQLLLKQDPLPNPALWSIAAYSVLFGLGAIRLSLEIWTSHLARSFLLVTLSLIGLVVALEFGWQPFSQATLNAIGISSAKLALQWFLFMTLLSYGRFVHLDAQGLVKRKGKKKLAKSKRAKSAKDSGEETDEGGAAKEDATAEHVPESTNGGNKVRIDAAHLSSPPRNSEQSASTDKPRGPLGPHFSKQDRKQQAKAGRS